MAAPTTRVITKRRPFRWTLSRERWFPTGLAIVALVGGIWVSGFSPFELLLFSASMTLGAIVAGFSGTCLSILMGLHSKTMNSIRKTSVLKILAKYLGYSIYSGIALSLVSIVSLMMLNSKICTPSEKAIFALWCGSVVYCLACFSRITVIMLRLFTKS